MGSDGEHDHWGGHPYPISAQGDATNLGASGEWFLLHCAEKELRLRLWDARRGHGPVDIIHPEIEVAGGDVPDRVFTRATLVHVLSTVLSVSGSVAVALACVGGHGGPVLSGRGRLIGV